MVLCVLKTVCQYFVKVVFFSDILLNANSAIRRTTATHNFVSLSYAMIDNGYICLFSFVCFITDIISM